MLTVFLAVVGANLIGLRVGGDVALPLLATQLLWINLVTDAAPALAIGMDRHSANLMHRMPRKPTDRLIDANMWRFILFTGLVMALATLATLDRVSCLGHAAWRRYAGYRAHRCIHRTGSGPVVQYVQRSLRNGKCISKVCSTISGCGGGACRFDFASRGG